MSDWYFAKDNRQLGPVTTESLRQLLANGSLGPADLVWRDGMREWAQVRHVPELTGGVAAPAPYRDATVQGRPVGTGAAVAAHPVSSSELGYYGAATEVVSERARETLKGFPIPTGPQDEWPLSAVQLDQFCEAEKQRKVIRGCANTFSALCLLYVIGAIAFAMAAAMPTKGPKGGVVQAFSLGLFGLMAGLAVLAIIAKRSVLRCRTWAPITFLVIFGLGIAMNVAAVALNVANPRTVGESMVGATVSIIFATLFAVPCIRALQAIPKFRAAPVWAQEALVKAKL